MNRHAYGRCPAASAVPAKPPPPSAHVPRLTHCTSCSQHINMTCFPLYSHCTYWSKHPFCAAAAVSLEKLHAPAQTPNASLLLCCDLWGEKTYITGADTCWKRWNEGWVLIEPRCTDSLMSLYGAVHTVMTCPGDGHIYTEHAKGNQVQDSERLERIRLSKVWSLAFLLMFCKSWTRSQTRSRTPGGTNKDGVFRKKGSN